MQNYAVLVTVLHTVQVKTPLHNKCSKDNEQKESTITHIGVYYCEIDRMINAGKTREDELGGLGYRNPKTFLSSSSSKNAHRYMYTYVHTYSYTHTYIYTYITLH